MLTQEYVKSIMEYDPETGEFKWKFRPNMRKCWNSRLAGKKTGCVGWAGKNKSEYILLRINDVLYKAHRVAWLYTYGEWPQEIDHIDLNGKNNKISNLRNCTRGENQCNRGMQSNNTSGFKGVSFDKRLGKWAAYIKINRKKRHLGLYENPELAHAAFCEAAEKYHGEFARIT